MRLGFGVKTTEYRPVLVPPAPVWYPLTIPDCVFAPQDGVGWFQDSAGTVPASVANDVVGYWLDPSPLANTMTQSTTADKPVLATGGRNGQLCLSFNGLSNYLMTMNTSIDLNKPYTQTGWVKYPAPGDDNVFMVWGYLYGRGTSRYLISTPNAAMTTGGLGGMASPLAYDDDTWHHIAATLDVANNAKLYVDATLVASQSAFATNYDLADYQGAALGSALGQWSFLLGCLSNPNAYSRDLTATEILGLYNNT